MNKLLSASILTACMAPCGAYSAQGDTWLQLHGFSRHLDAQSYHTLSVSSEQQAVVLGYDTNGTMHTEMVEVTHVSTQEHAFNEFNPGLGLGYELFNGLELRFGGYYNSFNKASFYAGANLHTSHDRLLSAGLMLGAVTGYNEYFTGAGDEINPMVHPTVAVNVADYRMELGYIPALESYQTDIVTLSFGVRY